MEERKDYIVNVLESTYEGLHGIEEWVIYKHCTREEVEELSSEDFMSLVDNYGLEDENENIEIENMSVIYELDDSYKLDTELTDLSEIAEKYGTVA